MRIRGKRHNMAQPKRQAQEVRGMTIGFRMTTIAGGMLLAEGLASGQSGSSVPAVPRSFAITGHEAAFSKELLEQLKPWSPKIDNLGNVWVTVGTGAPHRLIAAAIDKPGYVVSEITSDGFLRVQRLPQAPPNPVFDALNFAQPVVVVTRTGRQVPGVFAGLSVHLEPGRLNTPKMNHVEELYVDIGAKSAEEVRRAGVDVLDAIAPPQKATITAKVGDSSLAGPGTTEHVGYMTLIELVQRLNEGKAPGTTTVGFVTQQWLGGRGLNRLLTEIHPDEMVFLGRITSATPSDKNANAEEPQAGAGVLLGIGPKGMDAPESLAARFKALADKEQIPVRVVTAPPPRIAAYAKSASLPEQFADIGVPVLWPVTPAETVSVGDQLSLQRFLEAYLEIPAIPAIATRTGDGFGSGHEQSTIAALVEAYGASGHEEAVREKVKELLPEWVRNRATTDAAGNLVLHVGDAKADAKTPHIAFVAHMDEIGYEVKKIEDDGRLDVDVLGGGYPQYFLGHVALVHKKDGSAVGAVMEMPAGWDKPNFEFPVSMRSMDEPAHAYVGTKSKEETEKLGIAVGDYLTIPKQYVPLLGTRVIGRSFDDRVGDTALINAVRALGPNPPGRDVTFVWSTEEEVGLKGAAAFAEQAAKEGRTPDFVFAIDTFVSSDSPLESKRFADAELGKGFVVRAVDNSNVVPLQYVDRVVTLAKENGIAAQYGVTGGGNDGAVFTRYGSVDVALGWPLRYSHSPAEVIDTKDLDALSKIVEVLARKW
jgi:putative aminopeptidase